MKLPSLFRPGPAITPGLTRRHAPPFPRRHGGCPMLLRTLASAAVLLTGAALASAQPPAAPVRDPNVRPTAATSTAAEKPAAVVNGEPIALAEVKRLLDLRPYPVALPEEQKKALRQAALEMLVDDMLM